MAEFLSIAWAEHAGGLGGVMEARGPWAHKKDPDRTLFLNNRVTLVGYTLASYYNNETHI